MDEEDDDDEDEEEEDEEDEDEEEEEDNNSEGDNKIVFALHEPCNVVFVSIKQLPTLLSIGDGLYSMGDV